MLSKNKIFHLILTSISVICAFLVNIWIIPLVFAGLAFPLIYGLFRRNPFLSFGYVILTSILSYGVTPALLNQDRIMILADSTGYPETALIGIIFALIVSGVSYLLSSTVVALLLFLFNKVKHKNIET